MNPPLQAEQMATNEGIMASLMTNIKRAKLRQIINALNYRDHGVQLVGERSYSPPTPPFSLTISRSHRRATPASQ